MINYYLTHMFLTHRSSENTNLFHINNFEDPLQVKFFLFFIFKIRVGI